MPKSGQVVFFAFSLIIFLASCGGSGNGNGAKDKKDSLTLNMAPLTVIGFNDDSESLGGSYPVVHLARMPAGESVLLRVRDPYSKGDYYSIRVSNGWNAAPVGFPTADDEEPDNSPIEATALTWGNYSHHGLNPVLDEDWFSFTSSGENFHVFGTKANNSGSAADPILEIYDPRPNLGPIKYIERIALPAPVTLIKGVYDPANDFSLIAMLTAGEFTDTNEFYLIIDGPAVAGDYSVKFAAPPLPEDLPGSVTGSVHIDQYDNVGGRIIGSFDLTIIDVSRTTTIAGSFDVSRLPDEAGLLTGFKPVSSRSGFPPALGKLKVVSKYMRLE